MVTRFVVSRYILETTFFMEEDMYIGKVRTVSAIVGALGVSILMINTDSQSVSANSQEKTVTVGLVGDSDRQLWKYVKKDAAKKYHINVKLKVFTDYVKPNQALVDKSIDLNAMQTINYFNEQNKHLGNKLVSIGKTYVTPIRIYSEKYKTLADLPKNATIVVPNDGSNEKRALDVLEAAKLIKYDHSKKIPGVADITTNKKHFKIKEVNSEQTASALKSVDAGVVNTNYALDAKLDINKALYTEPINKANKGYINIIVSRKDSQHKKIYREVVKAYQTDKTKGHMKDLYGSAEKAAWDIKLK